MTSHRAVKIGRARRRILQNGVDAAVDARCSLHEIAALVAFA